MKLRIVFKGFEIIVHPSNIDSVEVDGKPLSEMLDEAIEVEVILE